MKKNKRRKRIIPLNVSLTPPPPTPYDNPTPNPIDIDIDIDIPQYDNSINNNNKPDLNFDIDSNINYSEHFSNYPPDSSNPFTLFEPISSNIMFSTKQNFLLFSNHMGSRKSKNITNCLGCITYEFDIILVGDKNEKTKKQMVKELKELFKNVKIDLKKIQIFSKCFYDGDETTKLGKVKAEKIMDLGNFLFNYFGNAERKSENVDDLFDILNFLYGKKLIEVDNYDSLGASILYYAIKFNRLEIVKFLLKYKPQMIDNHIVHLNHGGEIENDLLCSCFCVSASCCTIEGSHEGPCIFDCRIRDLLLSYMKENDIKVSLATAVMSGVKDINEMFKIEKYLNEDFGKYWTKREKRAGSEEEIKNLLILKNRGEKLTLEDCTFYNETKTYLIHEFIRCHCFEKCKLIFEYYKFSKELTNSQGHTLFLCCCMKKSFETDPQLKLKDDKETLDMAKYFFYEGCINQTSFKRNNSALQCAASCNNLFLCEWLLEKGANINAINISNDTALNIACGEDYHTIVELLMKKKADPYVRHKCIHCKKNSNAIEYCIMNHSINSLKILLKYKVQVILDNFEGLLNYYKHAPYVNHHSCDNCDSCNSKELIKSLVLSKKAKVVYCGNCNTKGINFKRCSRCKLVYYCKGECQKRNWRNHKIVCKKN